MNRHNILICPVCLRKNGIENPLLPSENRRSQICSSGHSFDRASTGYLNLLPPSGNRHHGDNKEMIDARRALLNSGLYAPLQKALHKAIDRLLDDTAVIWDSGCGEGYYTAAIADSPRTVYGSDLSTEALKAAAKRSDALELVAASAYSLPAQTSSCDALLCLFAPLALDEFRRILKPNGLLIEAVPGERHLFGLKEAIYDTPYENKVNRDAPQGFSILETIEIRDTVTLNDPILISQLFAMTPYAYRTNLQGRERLGRLDHLVTELHFYLFVYIQK